jgi:D-3-phosphoglycerate dehydrogenase
VTNTPGANAAAVAELTVALMLLLYRPVMRADRAVRAGEWPVLSGSELGTRTVGLLGAGQVGSRVARAIEGLGCTVLMHDPAIEGSMPLGELLPRAQVLSLHVPLTDDTRGMVGDELLGALPEGALLVNTARGELVDEAALARALDAGRVAGAALDALAEEPPGPDHPLVGRDDVIVTSHIGGHTAEARAAMGRQAMEDLLAVLDGRAPRHPVAP